MVTDLRIHNARKNPSILHKLRIINPGNKTGVTFAVTIPRVIANQFPDTYFRVTQNGADIILSSGCKIGAGSIDSQQRNTFNGLRMFINKYGQPEWIK